MKRIMKTMATAVCVVTASVGSLKAYNTANQSEADLLLTENIEALSAGDGEENSSCSASANCFNSSGVVTGTVSCSGHNGSCYSGEGYVSCDGTQSRCTYLPRPEDRDTTKCNQNGLPLNDE